MPKTAVIIQPGYLPWLGFFEQMHRADVFVIYDDVQYDKHGWRNRNRIKTSSGCQWLTVPVHTKNWPSMVKDMLIDNSINWRKKHLLSIRYNYSNAEHFDQYFSGLEKIILNRYKYIVDLCVDTICFIAASLGLKKDIRISSELGIDGEKAQRLINICLNLGADHYYNGAAGRVLYTEHEFMKSGIKLEFQDYKHPVYRQLFGGFLPYMSTIDLLFNHGRDSLDILLGRKNFKEEGNGRVINDGAINFNGGL